MWWPLCRRSISIFLLHCLVSFPCFFARGFRTLLYDYGVVFFGGLGVGDCVPYSKYDEGVTNEAGPAFVVGLAFERGNVGLWKW